jgi:hypothetical protein
MKLEILDFVFLILKIDKDISKSASLLIDQNAGLNFTGDDKYKKGEPGIIIKRNKSNWNRHFKR